MDRNTLIGSALIFLLFIAYSFYNIEQAKKAEKTKPKTTQNSSSDFKAEPPTEPSYLQEKTNTNSVETIDSYNDSSNTTFAQTIENLGSFAHAFNQQERELKLENQDFKITFSTKGGSIKKIELKNFQTFDHHPLILFDSSDVKFNYQFFTQNNRDINTESLVFELGEVNTDKENNKIIDFYLRANESQYFHQQYILPEKGFDLQYNITLVGFDQIIPKNSTYLSFQWQGKIKKLEQDKAFEDRYTQLFYRYMDDENSSLSESKNDKASLTTPVSWISFKQQFFNATLMHKDGFHSATVISETLSNPNYLKSFSASTILQFNHQQTEQHQMHFYFGPNHYQTLKSFHLDLESIIPLGTGIMSWVAVFNKYFIIPIFNFLEKFISSYGIIILILTLIVKTILFPLTYKSYKSAAMMKVLKPELDALKEKYADDQQKFGSEQWKLYQQAGVNPLGGCLPMLLQMPILIAMYYFFPASIELRQEAFLWASDLSTYDNIFNLPFTIPFYGDHVSLFTLLMTASSILYAMSNNQMMGTSPGMEAMKYMPYIFPIMLMGMFNSFPAALTYYYFLQNIISYGQQWAIKKFFINEEKMLSQIQENKKKPIKKSSFQSKLEEMTKQKEQNKKRK